MNAFLDPFSFVVTVIAGSMRRHQQEPIAYLVEENRMLREQIGNRRLKFNDDQRRRLAAKTKKSSDDRRSDCDLRQQFLDVGGQTLARDFKLPGTCLQPLIAAAGQLLRTCAAD